MRTPTSGRAAGAVRHRAAVAVLVLAGPASVVAVGWNPLASYLVRAATAFVAIVALTRRVRTPSAAPTGPTVTDPAVTGPAVTGHRSRRAGALAPLPAVSTTLVAGAFALGVVSGVVSAVQTVVTGSPPVDGVAALIYLGYGPLAVAGLLSLPWYRGDHGGRARALADAAVAGGSLWYVMTLLLPPGSTAERGPGSWVINIALTVVPALVVATALAVLAVVLRPARSLVAGVAIGVFLLGLSDIAYAWEAQLGEYRPTSPAAQLNQIALLVLVVAALTALWARQMAAAADLDGGADLYGGTDLAAGADLGGGGGRSSGTPVSGLVSDVLGLVPYVPLAGLLLFLAGAAAADKPLTINAPTLILIGLGVLARQVLAAREHAGLVGELGGALASAEHRAVSDQLTGVANRRALTDHVVALAQAGAQIGFALVDVVAFRTVNDNHGHKQGDAVLTAVADRLRAGVPGNSLVARVSGDQFAVVQPLAEFGSAELAGHAATLAEQISSAMPGQVEIGSSSWPLRIAVGVVCSRLVPESHNGRTTDTAAELLVQADLALRQAKNAPRGGSSPLVQVLTPLIRDQGQATSQLRECLVSPDLAQFTVQYQPIVDTRDGATPAWEALMRWTHPDLGPISPGVFIPLADACRSLGLLSDHVLATVTAQQAERLRKPMAGDCERWPSLRQGLTPVAVNLSAADITDERLPERIGALLDRHGLPGASLQVEITEDGVLTDFDAARRIVRALRGMGIRVAIDDFGTGYSSLRYLRRLHPDTIKIDREFVQAATTDGYSRRLVTAVADLAQSLRIDCIAEGVETAAELDVVTEIGIHLVQGFLLGRPRSAERAFRLGAAVPEAGPISWRAAEEVTTPIEP